MQETEMKISEPDQLPKPAGYKLLIAIPAPKTKTDGGIHLPEKFLEAEKTASIYGYVVALGPDAYQDPNKFPSGPLCAQGDWVIFRSYSGTRLKINGDEYRLINDDSVEAVIEDPRAIQRA